MNALQITLNHYLALGAILFVLGLAGLLIRRNYITVMMSLELLFAGAAINFAAFHHFLWHGQFLGPALVPLTLLVPARQPATRPDLLHPLGHLDERPAPLAHPDDLAVLQDRHQLPEHDLQLVGVVGEGLDAGLEPGDVTVVVGAPDVDEPGEAPGELVAVVEQLRN